MNTKIGDVIVFVVMATIGLMYVFGAYKIITDDENYHSKDVVLGMMLPPYTVYTGIKESFK